MRIALILLLGAFWGLNVFGQPEKPAEASVKEISLARDDGAGKPGEFVTEFVTTDIPIHCLIQLSTAKSVTVKMNLVAVKANTLKPETNIVTVSYTTGKSQNRVSFSASPDGSWSPGKYRADISLDGQFARSATFEIQKMPGQTIKENKNLSKPTPPLVKKRLVKKNRS